MAWKASRMLGKGMSVELEPNWYEDKAEKAYAWFNITLIN